MTIMRGVQTPGRILASMRATRVIRRVNGGERQVRWNSTGQAKPESKHTAFYKEFTRPVAKVLLMATFVYQIAYWGWQYLEKEEIKKERTAEIKELEAQLSELTKGKGKRAAP